MKKRLVGRSVGLRFGLRPSEDGAGGHEAHFAGTLRSLLVVVCGGERRAAAGREGLSVASPSLVRFDGSDLCLEHTLCKFMAPIAC